MGGKLKQSDGRGIMVSRPAKGNMMSRLRKSSCIVLAGYLLIWLFVQFPAHKQETDTVNGKSAEVVLPIAKETDKSEPEVKKVEQPPAPKWHDADCEQYRPLFEKYDWDVPTMMAIMQAESTNTSTGEPCDAQVVGDGHITYYENGRLYGYSKSLLQIRQLPGREACDTDDPEVIVQCGYNIWKSQGYSAWSVYTNGKYKNYL